MSFSTGFLAGYAFWGLLGFLERRYIISLLRERPWFKVNRVVVTRSIVPSQEEENDGVTSEHA